MGEEKKNEARLLFLRRARDKDVFQRDASVCVCVCMHTKLVRYTAFKFMRDSRSLSLSLSISLSRRFDSRPLDAPAIEQIPIYIYIYIYTTHGKCDDKLTYRMTRDVVSQLEFATIHDRLFECK